MDKRKVLFIDRDGTLVIEPPGDRQLDNLEKLEFYPGVFQWLGRIARELEYLLVMVTNQDGLGTPAFPEENFIPPHNKIIRAFANEDIHFSEILIDKTLPEENAPTRKPGTGMLMAYIHGPYNLAESWVIGDRHTDVQLARNLGCRSVFLGVENCPAATFSTTRWEEIYYYLKRQPRQVTIQRQTQETDISLSLNLDGTGKSRISTGIGFFDHLLEQLAWHGSLNLILTATGDLHVDEHHTIEDVALTLGKAWKQALGTKKGIARYGFVLPMDDSLARVAVDFGGRPWLVWDAEFRREKIGDMPAEMFSHFFKSFCDTAGCTLHIKAEGNNEHHKIEAIFKAFGRAAGAASQRTEKYQIPSTKGIL